MGTSPPNGESSSKRIRCHCRSSPAWSGGRSYPLPLFRAASTRRDNRRARRASARDLSAVSCRASTSWLPPSLAARTLSDKQPPSSDRLPRNSTPIRPLSSRKVGVSTPFQPLSSRKVGVSCGLKREGGRCRPPRRSSAALLVEISRLMRRMRL